MSLDEIVTYIRIFVRVCIAVRKLDVVYTFAVLLNAEIEILTVD